MLALFIGSARMQELEDACNTLFKIKQSKDPKLFGWYCHKMICYWLENDIIKSDNIKYVINLHYHHHTIIIISSLITVIKPLKILLYLLSIQ